MHNSFEYRPRLSRLLNMMRKRSLRSSATLHFLLFIDLLFKEKRDIQLRRARRVQT